MFNRLLEECLGIKFIDRIFIKDYEGIIEKYNNKFFDKYNVKVYEYRDIEKFRYIYEMKIKGNNEKCVVIASSEIYVPYDIQKYFTVVELSYSNLFPKLNPSALKKINNIDFEFLAIAYENLYDTLTTEFETKKFIENSFLEKRNVEEYVLKITDDIENIIKQDNTYDKWFKISEKKAKIRNLKLLCECNNESNNLDEEISENFKDFILSSYKGLTGRNSSKAPIILSKTMDFILMKQRKFALIVMDGMSVGDWQVISKEFEKIDFAVNYSFALIPTLTSISRQSLFSGKLPVEIENPFNLSKEKNLFIEKCKEYGYKQENIKYYRGYDIELSYKDKCIGIVINDIDDLVHSQLQGYYGMYRDVEYLAKSNKLQDLITNLYIKGYDVYITADHGNTKSKGIGKVRGTGIEVETKSKRVFIYKNFANEEATRDEFNLIDYPGYYLPKENKYLICQEGESFGTIGEEIISHGGISIDEVIVPFITIKGVENE